MYGIKCGAVSQVIDCGNDLAKREGKRLSLFSKTEGDGRSRRKLGVGIALTLIPPSIPFTRASQGTGQGDSTRWHPEVQNGLFLGCALGSLGLGVTQTGDQEGTLACAAAAGTTTTDLGTQST